MTRTTAFLLFLSPTLLADVVLLKDGSRVSGRVVEKGQHYEVTTDSGLRTFLKDEVDRVAASPKEFLVDVDQRFEEAKADYQRAVALGPGSEQTTVLREAAVKLSKARETTSSVRELFPEDKYADLDLKLVQIMQLLRMLRERMGSDLARRPSTNPNSDLPAPDAPPRLDVQEAVAVLVDPARRTDAAKRAAARETFKARRAEMPWAYDAATSAMIFLSRTDAEWKLQGPALDALQEYFGKPWVRELSKLGPEAHAAGSTWIATKLETLRKAGVPAEALALFGAGHVGHLAAGPERETAAKASGLLVQNGVAGTAEGHAVRDMNAWIASGDFDLAVLSFVKEHRAVDTPAVRFVWSYALLRHVHAKMRGWDRPAAALGTVAVTDTASRDHVAAMVKSIKAAATCNTCRGEGKLRCTNCHGKKELRWDCAKCKGTGKILEALGAGLGGRRMQNEIPCYPCRGRGFDKLIRCEKCKDGWTDCRQCEKEKAPPELDEICTAAPCATCDGRGQAFRGILWPCRSCLGLGQKLVPKADPAKVLP